MTSLAEAVDDLRRVRPPDAASHSAKQLEAYLQQIIAFAETHRDVSLDLSGDLLDQWNLLEALTARISSLRRTLEGRDFEVLIARISIKSPRRVRTVIRLRENALDRVRAWERVTLDKRAGLRWQFSAKGLALFREVIARELAHGAHDDVALNILLERIEHARPGDWVLLGDLAETIERVFRLAIGLAEESVTSRLAKLDALRPLSEEELERAQRDARRADGSIDANAFALAFATDLGGAIPSSDPHPGLRRRGHRYHGDGEDE